MNTSNESENAGQKCLNQGCPWPAKRATYWPGQGRVLYCTYHADKAVQIAEAMGFVLHVEELE